jgi:hypothetical protein
MSGKSAIPIREDRIIRTIRAIKKRFGVAQMNELFVCEADLPKHMERRRSFERTMLFASIFAGLVVILLLYSIISSGRFDAWAIVSAFVVALFVLALPLFRYTPAVEQGAFQQPKPSAPILRPAPEKRPGRQAKQKHSPRAKKKR